MLDRVIVNAVICLLLLVSGARVSAQDEPAVPPVPVPEAAPAGVELSLSVAPQVLFAHLLPGAAGVGGLGGLGGLGNGVWFPMLFDVGIGLAPSTFLVLGLGGAYSESGSSSVWRLEVPVSVLQYLETPRVGAVLPTLRVGGVVGWQGATLGGQRAEFVTARLLVRGGATWIAARWLALRAEIGANGEVIASEDLAVSFGLEASIALVLRL